MLQFYQLLKVTLLPKQKVSSSLVLAISIQINQLRGFVKHFLWLVLNQDQYLDLISTMWLYDV